MPKQVILAAHFPGVNNQTVWSDPAAGSQIDFASFVHLAKTAERGRFDFFFLAEGLRLREQRGRIHDLDVVGRPDALTVLSGLAAVTEHLGLGATRERHVQRAVPAGPPARHARPPLRRAGGVERGHLVRRVHRGELPPRRVPRLQPALRAGRRVRRGRPEAVGLWDADALVADKPSAVSSTDGSRARSGTGARSSTSPGNFTVPRSPQRHPVIIQAGDSDAGRDFGAATADAIFNRHGTLEAGRAFFKDVKEKVRRHGRDPDTVKLLPGVTFVLGDSDADAQERAHHIRRQQVSPQTAILLLEQVWNRDLSNYDADGPLPEGGSRRRRHVDHPGPDAADGRPAGDRGEVARARRGEEPQHPRPHHRGHRAAVVHRHARARRRAAEPVRADRRVRRLHRRAAPDAHRPRRVRRHGGAAAAGARRAPHRIPRRCATPWPAALGPRAPRVPEGRSHDDPTVHSGPRAGEVRRHGRAGAARDHRPRPAGRGRRLPPVLAGRAPLHPGRRQLGAGGADRARRRGHRADPGRLRRRAAGAPDRARGGGGSSAPSTRCTPAASTSGSAAAGSAARRPCASWPRRRRAEGGRTAPQRAADPGAVLVRPAARLAAARAARGAAAAARRREPRLRRPGRRHPRAARRHLRVGRRPRRPCRARRGRRRRGVGPRQQRRAERPGGRRARAAVRGELPRRAVRRARGRRGVPGRVQAIGPVGPAARARVRRRGGRPRPTRRRRTSRRATACGCAASAPATARSRTRRRPRPARTTGPTTTGTWWPTASTPSSSAPPTASPTSSASCATPPDADELLVTTITHDHADRVRSFDLLAEEWAA